MKLRNVRCHRHVFAELFKFRPGISIGVEKGLPEDAELVNIQLWGKKDEVVLTFFSETFEDVKQGDQIPTHPEVVFIGYGIVEEIPDDIEAKVLQAAAAGQIMGKN